MMKILILLLLTIFLVMQYKLWLSPTGVKMVKDLQNQLTNQVEINKELKKRNTILLKKIKLLKSDENIIEDISRLQFGMIKADEVFYRF